MTLEVRLNPPGLRADYLRGLNEAFGDWGGDRYYDWCFERSAGSFAPDLMIMRKDGALIAGSAVSYRKARLSSGAEVDLGIMTGSWTLPAARGQGCFTTAIEESVKATAAHGGALLLAFVTETNASYRRLRAAGAGLFATHYVSSSSDTPLAPRRAADPAVTEVADPVAALEWMRDALDRSRAGTFRLRYPGRAWRGQLLDRPGETAVFELEDQGRCVIEAKDGSDRVQLLALAEGADEAACLRSLLRRAQIRQRRLFLFATRYETRAVANALGMLGEGGVLTALIADPQPLGSALGLKPGWTLPNSTALADTGDPWYLGPIAIQSGERM